VLNEPIIAQVPLFAGLPHAELVFLAETLRQITIPADTMLLREGEHGDRCYIVLDGQVEIVKACGTADERLLGRCGTGVLFGEMCLLNPDHLARRACARACPRCCSRSPAPTSMPSSTASRRSRIIWGAC
jgi:CRP-like cAMP-binding protein